MKLFLGLFIFAVIFQSINSQVSQSAFSYFEIIDSQNCGNQVFYFTGVNNCQQGCTNNYYRFVQSTNQNDTFTGTSYSDSSCTIASSSTSQFTFTCDTNNNWVQSDNNIRVKCYNLNTQAPVPNDHVNDSSSSVKLLTNFSVVILLGFLISFLMF